MPVNELARRALPPLMEPGSAPGAWPARRSQLMNLLQSNLYGVTPPAPDTVSSEIVWEETVCYAGKAAQQRILLRFTTPAGEYTFPMHLVRPLRISKPPVLLHIAFRPSLRAMHRNQFANIDDRYAPVEEMLDRGFAYAMFCYQDISSDSHDGDYSTGLSAMYPGRRGDDAWGRIGMWAFAASRVMDYLMTREDLDRDCISVAGHSRLGKTALWCGAQDHRFFASISNNSGFNGAALAKGGEGERVADFIRVGSADWFCPRFRTYLGREEELPYDQHFLLALCAPRRVLIGSAQLDRGADPKSEFLSALAATEAYRLLGLNGLVTTNAYPVPGSTLHSGHIGYHLRDGRHFFSRYDWNRYMDYIDLHRGE